MTDLTTLKAIPIEDYAHRCGFTPVRKGKYISLAEHDSVMIDPERNCFWRNSKFHRGEPGGAGSIIDFAMEFGDCENAGQAIVALKSEYGFDDTGQPHFAAPVRFSKATEQPRHETEKLVLPERDDNVRRVFWYLCQVRKIDPSVVRYFLRHDMLYQDKRKNCVFVSQSKRFVCCRSTGEKRFVADVPGSDYDECFYFRGNKSADTLIAAEGVIDIMSLMTEKMRRRERYSDACWLALSGTGKLPALFHHLREEQTIRNVVLAFDRDEAGEQATDLAVRQLKEAGFAGQVTVLQSPRGKDWNEYLQFMAENRENKAFER